MIRGLLIFSTRPIQRLEAPMSLPSPDCTLRFLGDIACPHALVSQLKKVKWSSNCTTVVNLEGALIAPDEKVSKRKRLALYNTTEILSLMREWNVRVASLNNNHITDIVGGPAETARRLEENGIMSCGAGATLTQASAAARIDENTEHLLFLGFGWKSIECRPATPIHEGVNPLIPEYVLESVRHTRQKHPHARLVVLMHWDYDLERYPMPAQRQLAHDLIAEGADAIVGHHPHCVQGIERIEGKPIVYSLGNWFLPHGDWFGAPISLPEYSRLQLAFEWTPSSGEATCRWYEYDPSKQAVEHILSEPLEDSERVRELTPFAGFSHDEYRKWFRKHRVKRRLWLPVYEDYRQTIRNRWLDQCVRIRGTLVRMLNSVFPR